MNRSIGTSGMMSAAASLGLSLLWDTDVGLSHVDKYTYSSEEHIKVSGDESKTMRLTNSCSRPVRCLPQVFSIRMFGQKQMPLLPSLAITSRTSLFR